MRKEEKKFTSKKSVDWYDPRQLVKTGIKVLISSIFGDFNDKRELQAALHTNNDKKHFDHFSEEEELWIDYVADTGDGFDATFTMAKLLAKPNLDAEGVMTQSGQILIMGGDQVYPAASREEYNNRLKGPYAKAFRFDEEDKSPPHVFAIPGNHDWYDGLTNFLKIFGQKRNIGNLRTQQVRSYFALKLPHNVWLLGIDVQLNSDIDYNQIKYFQEILEAESNADSKLIICTAEPSWIHHSANKPSAYNNLKFFEKKVLELTGSTQILTLAGDLHHYARYLADDGSLKITAGGGGAFMHPTQNLPNEIPNLREGKVNLQKTYPSSKKSQRLLFRNFWFAISSLKLSIMLGTVYLFTSSILYLHFDGSATISLSEVLAAAVMNPFVFAICLLFIFGCLGFSDTTPSDPKIKSKFPYWAAGFIHGVFQTLLLLLLFWKTANLPIFFPESTFLSWLSIQAIMFFLGGFIAGTVFGLYLMVSNFFLRNHDNEAYSSLRWTGYKNFIRIHITKNELKIYPFGVKDVQKWKSKKKDGTGEFVPDREIKPELIENIDSIKL